MMQSLHEGTGRSEDQGSEADPIPLPSSTGPPGNTTRLSMEQITQERGSRERGQPLPCVSSVKPLLPDFLSLGEG